MSDPVFAPSPVAHDLVPTQLRSEAELIRTSFVAIRAACRDDVWRGALATAFQEQLDRRERRLAVMADELQLVATRLERRSAEAALAGDPLAGGARVAAEPGLIWPG